MEIISGLARGVMLAVPPGETVRPTAARARKALFDSLGDFTGIRVADLCAGAGGLGLEAASRGAAQAVFVERDLRHSRVLERNLAAIARTGVTAEMRIVNCDVREIGRWCAGAFDVIFADPPYAESGAIFAAVLPELRQRAAGALLVWEIPDTPGAKGDFMVPEARFRKFGAAEFLLLGLAGTK